MINKGMRRLSAFALAVIVGMTSVTGYGSFAETGMAVSQAAESGNTDTVTFAEGEGTGKDFSETSWKFTGKLKEGASTVPQTYMAGIVKDKDEGNYLNDDSTVIRLIRGVKAADSTSGLESNDSYDKYRSGEAFLSKGIKMNTTAKFSVKFTFSMPEAVVNTIQTGGKDFAREVGGDGIAFVMTTNSTHDVQAGSGIGYQGIDNSVAIELDSFFNGAYCMIDTGSYAYQNWGFDNQLYFHRGSAPDGVSTYGTYNPWDSDYENYVNPNNEERFDHVAITLNGDVKTHKAISYINGLDPTDLDSKTNFYKNLANRYNPSGQYRATGSNEPSTSSKCSTRFTDKGVNNRLFTVWIDYDGSDMNVSYANGKFSEAVKPDIPQISTKVDLSKFDGKEIYMGFTSAVGSSKANHTIHSFQFSNTIPSSYNVEYYIQKEDGTYPATPDYKIEAIDKYSNNQVVEVGDDVEDKDYQDISGINELKAYSDSHAYTTVAGLSKNKITVDADGTSTLKLYYKCIKTKYTVEYYLQDKKDPTKYVKQEHDTKTVMDATPGTNVEDSEHKKIYPDYTYTTVTGKSVSEITVAEDGSSVLKLYYNYDPAKTTYKVEYYLQDKKDPTKYVKQEHDTKTVMDVTPGTNVEDSEHKKIYPDYTYTTVTGKSVSEITVAEDGSSVLKLYYNYDPAKTTYKVEYYLQDKKDPTKYVKQEHDTKTVMDATPGTNVEDNEHKKIYPDYTYTTVTGKSVSEITVAEDGSSVLKLYYKYTPAKTTYKTEYYLKQEDDTYKLVDTVPGEETYPGTIVNAVEKTYDGYTHVKIDKSVESAEVEADGSTTLKVYYDPRPATPAYKVNYYKLNPETGEYEYITSTGTIQGNKDQTYTVTDADPAYTTRYKSDGYVVNEQKNETYSVKLTDAGKVYEMDVYYDPAKATYKTEYYLQNKDGSYTKKETVQGEETYVGTDVSADIKEYDGYTHVTISDSVETAVVQEDNSTTMKVYYKYTPAKTTYKTEHYLKQADGTYKLVDTVPGEETYPGTTVNAVEKTYDGYTHVKIDKSVESAEVEADGSTTLKVYYDPKPATPAYKVNYYKLNPETGEYEYITSTGAIQGNKDQTYTVTDADPAYTTRYKSDGYVVNEQKNETYSVKLTDAGKIYEMDVYYDPAKATYKTEYYLQNEDGSYTKKETVQGEETYVGTDVSADIKEYDGYTHVTISDSVEMAVVQEDNSTTMKVYYNLNNPTYTVQYYVQQKDGTYRLYTEKKDISGKTGETVTADIIAIDGYVHTTIADTKETDKVAADNSTVLKVYYNLKAEATTEEATTEEATTEEVTTAEVTTTEATTTEEFTDEDTDEDTEETKEPKANKPKTGDATNITFLIIVMLATTTTGAICIYFRKKEDE